MSEPIDRDVYALALSLMRWYGPDGAGFHAAQRADELFSKGDDAGMRMWTRVIKAIDVLAAQEPPPGSAKH